MNTNEMNDTEISILDLLWDLLSHWKVIFLCTIGCALIGLGFSYYNHSENIEAEPVELTEEEQLEIDEINNLLINLDVEVKYRDESILMNLDRDQSKELIMQYYVDFDSSDMEKEKREEYLSKFTNAYVFYAQHSEIAKDIIDIQGINEEEIYIDEIVSANTGGQSYIFYVKAYAKNDAMMNRVVDAIEKVLQDYHETVEANFGQHALMLMNKSISKVSSEKIESIENENKKIVESLVAINEKIEEFSDVQYIAFTNQEFTNLGDSTKTMFNWPDRVVTMNNTSGNSMMKILVIATLFGFMFSVIVFSIVYVFSKNLKSIEEIENAYGIYNLGTVSDVSTGKRKESKTNTKIRRLRTRDSRTTEEKETAMYTNILLLCKKESIAKIFIVSSLNNELLDMSIIEKIIEKLRQDDIEVECGSDFVYNSNALRVASEFENVILLEKVKTSRKDLVNKEIEICTKYEMNILGIIGIE